MPAPDPVPQGTTREEMRDAAADAAESIITKLNDMDDKINDILEKVSE